MDHLTIAWAAIFAFLGTQQTIGLGFGYEEGFYYIIYDEWALLYHMFVGPLDIDYLINHILGQRVPIRLLLIGQNLDTVP